MPFGPTPPALASSAWMAVGDAVAAMATQTGLAGGPAVAAGAAAAAGP
ncbi:hypothetical protein H7I94_21795, partial [Mycobacterium szulgai]|nr:hypothetical protein [Mycobacterium szulgai]